MSVEIQTKAIVTVAEMARMVGLSRARFYQLQKAGVFPLPVYDVCTCRPIYVEELQEVCLEVRKRNCGVNGKPVLFYSRRLAPNPIPSKVRKTKPKTDDNEALAGVRALGLTSATAVQVECAVKKLFPQGTSAVDQGEVIRAVFIHLQRQNSVDKVGR
jgi:hypothetical protein